MKKTYLFAKFVVVLLFFLPFVTSGQTILNVKGEVLIEEENSQLVLVYDNQKIPFDSSLELIGESYVYLTLKADAEIKSISTAGLLRIQGDDMPRRLDVGLSNTPPTAIACDALELGANVNVRTMANEHGIKSNSYIQISGNTSHSIYGSDISVSAGSFITIDQSSLQAGIDDQGNATGRTGIIAGSPIILRKAAVVTVSTLTAGLSASDLYVHDGSDLNVKADINTGNNSYGVHVSGNIIVDGNSSLSGEGDIYGILSENGIIRAENATIHGIRNGLSGSNNAIHRVGKIFASTGGHIVETYKSANITVDSSLLTTYSLLANNMEKQSDYTWDFSNGNGKAFRSSMIATEKVKMDNSSDHTVILEGATP